MVLRSRCLSVGRNTSSDRLSGNKRTNQIGSVPQLNGETREQCHRETKENIQTKQKRQAEHIADSYEDRGVSEKEAKGRAWATVNKESGGGKKSGRGRAKNGKKGNLGSGGKH